MFWSSVVCSGTVWCVLEQCGVFWNSVVCFGAVWCVAGGLELSCAFTMAVGGLHASRHLHAALLCALMRAPQTFYDRTPRGRVLTRVCDDMASIDLVLHFSLRSALNTVLGAVAAVGVIASSTPLFLVTLPGLALVYCLLQVTGSSVSGGRSPSRGHMHEAPITYRHDRA